MKESPLKQSSWGRAKQDTVSSQKTARFMWGGEGVLAVAGGSWLVQIAASSATTIEIVGRSVIGGLGGLITAILIVFAWNVYRAPYRQRNEARKALISTPGATPNSPKVASLELHFSNMNYKFIGDNPPLLLIHFDAMPTGNMYLEQAEIEILGRRIPFADWETETVSPSVTFGFTNHCEIKDKLPTGNHDIRILILANREWWASDWQTITYSPSVPDKEGSQT